MQIYDKKITQNYIKCLIPINGSTIDLWNNAKQHPDELAASGYPNYVAYPNTDWWNEIYKKQWMQKHSISISGKEKRSGYTMSLGYTKNPGIVRSTGYERFQGRINLYSDVTDWLRVGSRIWGHVTNHDVIVTTGVDIFQANTLQRLEYLTYLLKHQWMRITL